MPTKNVVLTDHQAHFVENLVVSGRYQNASLREKADQAAQIAQTPIQLSKQE